MKRNGLSPSLFSAKSREWSTPQALVDGLAFLFGRFDVDVCATPETAKCAVFITPEEDALTMDWRGTCWMNPPYGRGISKWVRKAYVSGQEEGTTIVCLLPARTETEWWHRYVVKAETVLFLKGRIQFSNIGINAPFPSAVVVFR